MTVFSPEAIKFWGILSCLIYWIALIVLYIKEYNSLKDSVLRRFPEVYEQIFKQSPDLKDKYEKLENWSTNSITAEMYQEDLNIKNHVLKLHELDFFRVIVFASLIVIMIIT
ncbi:MAG: hypothetical protein EOM05_07630, partial [Clostridia bacterium]|nr:hypothetical protein [Clostridia bacterium]